MSEHFEIRQQVATVNKSWLEVVETGTSRSEMSAAFDKWVAEFPDEYFELAMVSQEEQLISFAPTQG